MTIEEIKEKYSIVDYLERKGIHKSGTLGLELEYHCPFHDDTRCSFFVNQEKKVWTCMTGCGGGSIIDLVMKFENISIVEAIKKLNPDEIPYKPPLPAKKFTPQKLSCSLESATHIYNYTDEKGEYLYSKLRFEPKTFRQAVIENDRVVAWNLKGVRKVLYNLPAVVQSSTVFLCEGEKDAETLIDLGYAATTGPDGASSWMDGYSDFLAGRDVIIFPDNDEAGGKMLNLVKDSIAKKAKTVKVVKIPTAYKDITEYLDEYDVSQQEDVIEQLLQASETFVAGYQMRSRSFDEDLQFFRTRDKGSQFSLNLLTLHSGFFDAFRPIRPGELVTIAAASGAGKTTILSNIILHTNLLIHFFQLELSKEQLVSRLCALKNNLNMDEVENRRYAPDNNFCPIKNLITHYGSLELENIKKEMNAAELCYGKKPEVIMIDYANLLHTKGTEYEALTLALKALRLFAVDENVIVIIGCQLKKNDSYGQRVKLTDLRGTGSLIDSSSVILGCYQDESNEFLITEVLKATSGKAGTKLYFKPDFLKYKITEAPYISDDDIEKLEAMKKETEAERFNRMF